MCGPQRHSALLGHLLLSSSLAVFVVLCFALGSRSTGVLAAAANDRHSPAAVAARDASGCRGCHQEEVDSFARTGMGRSMRLAGKEPAGVVQALGTTITMSSTANGRSQQTLQAADEAQHFPVSYVIGSGEHASGYLVDLDDHLFQSPVAYYRSRSAYDLAPGYENKGDPDFTRPVAEGCVFCHADANTFVAGTVNQYGTTPFRHLAIGCDRCHGSAEAHMAKPQWNNIINPARLPRAARDGVCEQCHLIGTARILNPGKSLTDYKPGDLLENTLTIYHNVPPEGTTAKFKVISHSEQFALSACARKSDGRMWCGTCHDPHLEPAQPVAYFRERCLTCHAKTIFPASHPPLASDCIGCHMPKREAQDGGHSAFTDHRIERQPASDDPMPEDAAIAAWREPSTDLQKRNLGVALIEVGVERRSPKDLIAGYHLLTDVQQQFQADSEFFTSLGSALLLARSYSEASIAFEKAVQLDAGSSPKQANLAQAYLGAGQIERAQQHLERAVEIDPLNLPAIADLLHLYDQQGDAAHSRELSRQVAERLHQASRVDLVPSPRQ